MSYASDVKEEIARIELSDDSKRAQLSALVQCLGTFGFSSGVMNIKVRCANAVIIKRICSDIQTLYDVKAGIAAIKQQNLDKRNIYSVTINEKVKDILYDLDLWTEKGIQEHPRLGFLNTDEMLRSYVAGCFMASGTVNDPKTPNYHLEFKANSESHAAFLVKILDKFFIKAKITERRGHSIVYIKMSDAISDVLRVIGADNALMLFESERIDRDVVNSLHRLDNVTIANEQKSQQVSDMQIEAIEYLMKRDLLKYLSEKDREIALIRYNNPNATLNELSEIYYQQSRETLSKSGIRHRFEKVFALVEKYKEKEKNK